MKACLISFLLLPMAALAAETNALPALVPAYPEIPPTFWEQHKAIIVVGVVLFFIAQFFTLYRVLARVPTRAESPESQARTALQRLLDEPEDGRLLSDVSRILRGYFGRRFQMPGEEATTAEFISALEHNGKIMPSLGEKVSSFLRQCDARKFSPSPPLEQLDAVAQALDLVNEAETWRSAQNPDNA